jgi:hypothetical protein
VCRRRVGCPTRPAACVRDAERVDPPPHAVDWCPLDPTMRIEHVVVRLANSTPGPYGGSPSSSIGGGFSTTRGLSAEPDSSPQPVRTAATATTRKTARNASSPLDDVGRPLGSRESWTIRRLPRERSFVAVSGLMTLFLPSFPHGCLRSTRRRPYVPVSAPRWSGSVGAAVGPPPLTITRSAWQPARQPGIRSGLPRVDCEPSPVPALGAPYSCLGHLGTGT